jgi:methionyl-tRNA formyltransferase
MGRIDLYLGSDLGHWALEQIPAGDIRQVFTLDESIAEAARKLGVKVWVEDANSVNFDPAGFGFSIHYPRILKPAVISRYDGLYNLHPGYLPWGRGFYPIFWALWEQTPAGATLHEISPGLDEGPIVSQIQVAYDESDTGESLFRRVREAEKALFLEYWPSIADGKAIPSFSQETRVGSFHSRREFLDIKGRANLEGMSANDLLRLARCLTFPPYTGLLLTLGEQSFELCLKPVTQGNA